jgi:molybdate transport system substrate-binding protein
MRKNTLRVLVWLAVTSATSALWADVTISAAISLKPALDDARPLLEKAAGQPLTINYGASGTLAGQIRQGAPVDLFLSADLATAQKLADAGNADKKTLSVFATGQLVLVVPADNPAHIAAFADLAGPAVKKIAIGEPKVVPAGAYAQQALTALHLWDPLQRSEKLVTAENVAQALTFAARGEVDAAIVYATDALANNKVKQVAVAPADSHQPIEYAGVVPVDSPDKAAAAAIQKALASPEVQALFKSHGFAAPPAAATAPAR